MYILLLISKITDNKINGRIIMHKKLFIPGPIEVKRDVLERMSTPYDWA